MLIKSLIRSPELKLSPEGSTLTFRTFRTGFPSALYEVVIDVERDDPDPDDATLEAITNAGAFATINRCDKARRHWQWICDEMENEYQPFWIADTDLVFFSDVERLLDPLEGEAKLAGEHNELFWQPELECWCQERLHTCLMLIDPSHWTIFAQSRAADLPASNHADAQGEGREVRRLFYPYSLRHRGKLMLYDTAAWAYHYHYGACTAFSEEILACYEHLGAGTYARRVPGFQRMTAYHDYVFAQPQRIRGLRNAQRNYRAGLQALPIPQEVA